MADNRLAYTIEEAAAAVGIGRTKLYEEIELRRLVVTKVGRRSIILASDLAAWLSALPKLQWGPKT